MYQTRSHPWSGIPFDRRYPVCFTFVIQDLSLGDIESCSGLIEVCVLGCTQILVVILSEMYCCLHGCSREDSPDHPIDVDVQHFVPFMDDSISVVHLKRLSRDG